jgi:hypothetical protein
MGGAVAGSVVGHGISNMIFGGSRHADSAQAADAPPPPAEYARQAQQATGNCDIPAKGEWFGSNGLDAFYHLLAQSVDLDYGGRSGESCSRTPVGRLW